MDFFSSLVSLVDGFQDGKALRLLVTVTVAVGCWIILQPEGVSKGIFINSILLVSKDMPCLSRSS